MTSRQLNTSRDKGARRRVRLVGMVVLVFVIWALTTAFKQADVVEEKQSQLEQLGEKLSETAEKNEMLKLEIIRLNDPEYIEQKARKDYQMVRDGETLFTEPEASE